MLGRAARTFRDEAKTPQTRSLARRAASNAQVDMQDVRSRVSQY